MSASKKVRVLKAMRTILQEYKAKIHTTKVGECGLCKLFHLFDVKPHECLLCPMFVFYFYDGWACPCKNRKCEPVDCRWESSYLGTKKLEAVIEFYEEVIEKIKTMTNEEVKAEDGFKFLIDIDKKIAKKYKIK